ncbi:MAG TPA: hypothetical protein VJY33_06330 [Isosphaeraceae bacterium]|nr:hypothetical protein [Isosphaeraceae bacterium]
MTAISAASATESHETTNPFPDLPAIRGPDARPQPPRPRGPTARRFPRPRFGDYSRTRFESRVAFGGPDEDEDAEEFIATPTRRFSLLETTSGLPDDSREADERFAEWRLRDLRGRVKPARAAISSTPGAEEVLRRDWVKAARFYAKFGITEAQFRHGVPSLDCLSQDDPFPASLAVSVKVLAEPRARKGATLPA